MLIEHWGLLGPEEVASGRRTRTLGVGAAVRTFNDLAVPGLGGIWFAKPLLWATLGVSVAQRTGRRNIEVANAVEAVASWLSLDERGWRRDARMRGATKMRSKTDLSYSAVSRPSFYVTQPFRQATVQALVAFGLVDAEIERFNGFSPSSSGRKFIDAACDGFRPYKKTVEDLLVEWVKGERKDLSPGTQLTRALSAADALPDFARETLQDLMIRGRGREAERRRAASYWVDDLRAGSRAALSWEIKPARIDQDHWRDLHIGARFFQARDRALELLDRVEAHVDRAQSREFSLERPAPEDVSEAAASLRESASQFLDEAYDPTPQRLATVFCHECTAAADTQLLERLVQRDGRALRLRGRTVVPGPAFEGAAAIERFAPRSTEDEGQETPVNRAIAWPDGISYRLNNLFLLKADLRGELDQELGVEEEEEAR